MNHEDLGYPEYHYQGMGCGLEDRGITDRYEAMQYGWDEAIERCASEVIDPIFEHIEQSTVSIQDAWVACGGNEGIKATKNELLTALRLLDGVEEEYHSSQTAYNAVIGYMLGKGYMESPLEFLRCWNEGNFEALREEWPDAPEEIYLADPLYKGKK